MIRKPGAPAGPGRENSTASNHGEAPLLEAGSMLLDGSAVVFGVGGASALLVTVAVWWLTNRRHRSMPITSSNDATIGF
jgi:hypothetical protein